MKRVFEACVVSSVCLWSFTAAADESSTPPSNEEFVARAATSGSTEVDIGKLAVQFGERAEVKAYGEQIVRDHAAASKELLALAARKQIPVPRQVDAKQQDVITKLSKLRGSEFDRAFVSHMVNDHRATVTLFRLESEQGRDPELKAYATKILPTLKEHLRLARELSGESPSGTQAAAEQPRDK